MADDWHPLTTEERAMLAALLAEAFEGRDQLVAQMDGATARTIDSDGSFALTITGPVARVPCRVPVAGSTYDPDGMGVEVLLHVIDGRMAEVEVYRVDGQVVHAPVDPSTLELITLPVVG